jgi:hypothetical protein
MVWLNVMVLLAYLSWKGQLHAGVASMDMYGGIVALVYRDTLVRPNDLAHDTLGSVLAAETVV